MNSFCFSIDRGGTFTDIYALTPKGILTRKLLSENPTCYADAPREGIRRILSEFYQKTIDPHSIDESPIRWIRMGTTVATNALLERKGEPLVWITTQGFRDLLQIGTQNRPKIFDLQIQLPEPIHQAVFEVPERIHWIANPHQSLHPKNQLRQGVSGEWYFIEKKLEPSFLKEHLQKFYLQGFRSLAISLLHGYDFQEHERLLGEIAQEIGFTQISLSCEICPQIKLLQRGDTTTLDAYLTPKIQQYLQSFRQGFKNQLRQTPVLFMQSHGGLIDATQFFGSRAILSGPAGGVVGYSSTSPTSRPSIGFDMGGTSTDVSRFAQNPLEMTQETEISGIRIQLPQLSIRTVAAGGGSCLKFQDGKFQVGPESVGANPGPVCYGKGSQLAITDANLLLGRILPQEFPCVFGPNENQPLNTEKTILAFDHLTQQIQQETSKKYSREEVAYGFIQVANELMARPIREISIARGYDIQKHQLVCFGGASGQHACAIAKNLGIRHIFVHQYASVLSAVGISLADRINDHSLPTYGLEFTPENLFQIEEKWHSLEQKIRSQLQTENIQHLEFERFLHLRAEGAFHSLMLPFHNYQETLQQFYQYHQQEYGFQLLNRKIFVDDVRLRGLGKNEKLERLPIPKSVAPAVPKGNTSVYFENGWQETPYYERSALFAGHSILGPAILLLDGTTLLIEPHCQATISSFGDIEILVTPPSQETRSTQCDPIQLSIFHHLFMSIAEQMGRNLQKIAVSTNIKERLDFSCAIFDAEGNLVANAPHIPVHLGAMGESVRAIYQKFVGQIELGDVFITNNPYQGGSHLPDITVVTPVLEQENVIFFVASRGHHADIGGITPGSMPPFSSSIHEEGICIEGQKLVKKGIFQEEHLRTLLTSPILYQGKSISGSRKISDNLADLRAQIAANQKGVLLLQEMIQNYSLPVVSAYMQYIQENAEQVIRQVIQDFKTRFQGKPLEATEKLDDGSRIHLQIQFLDQNNIRFDFSGTDPELMGNLNAPRAITTSAILYVLRTLVNREIPLNSGCLKPVEIVIPENTLLSPSFDSAIVGGNVETSQRIVDVLLKAFQVAAGSQGTMNNLTFGNDHFGYYETIAGGAGATPNAHGQHAVHTHMTNTKITDPEILERLYPILIRIFAIRKHSGGSGQFHGGDGILRELEFLAPLELSILSERRVFPPYGLHGGEPGSVGQNRLIRQNGKCYQFGGKGYAQVFPGDRLRIETPGGGGYGIKH